MSENIPDFIVIRNPEYLVWKNGKPTEFPEKYPDYPLQTQGKINALQNQKELEGINKFTLDGGKIKVQKFKGSYLFREVKEWDEE